MAKAYTAKPNLDLIFTGMYSVRPDPAFDTIYGANPIKDSLLKV